MCLSFNLTRITHIPCLLGVEMETRMKIFPWLSRAAKQDEKRDALEVQGNGFNLGAIWSFLDGGSRGNESDEPVNDATALSVATVYRSCLS
jgi:hypothetical protein